MIPQIRIENCRSMEHMENDEEVALISFHDDYPLLGTARQVSSRSGLLLCWSAPAKGYRLPLIAHSGGESAIYRVRLLGGTVGKFFNRPNLWQLAEFYSEACTHFNWNKDDFVTLNVAFYLYENGIRVVNNANLQVAMEIIVMVRRSFYAFADHLQSSVI